MCVGCEKGLRLFYSLFFQTGALTSALRCEEEKALVHTTPAQIHFATWVLIDLFSFLAPAVLMHLTAKL